MSTYYYMIDYLTESPLIVQIIWSLSIVFITLTTGLIFYLAYLRRGLRKKARITAVYQQKYESYLINYLYAGNEEEEITAQQQVIINQLKNATVDPFIRKILISQLMKLKNEISGEIATAIENLYLQTELVKYAEAKLKSDKWYVIAKGIAELNQFHVRRAHNDVIKHINHPERKVRKEMQLYMINLFYFDGLDFLNHLEMQLSDWDQIQLLGALQQLEDQNIPDMNSWLNSTNNSVVFFALKLAEIYNQFVSKEEILKLLNHNDIKIRLKAIFVLNYLNVVEAKDILKLDIDNRSEEEQIAFFKMMENLYTTDDTSFILSFITSSVFEIKVSVLKILKVLDFRLFIEIKTNSSDATFLRMANFIENN